MLRALGWRVDCGRAATNACTLPCFVHGVYDHDQGTDPDGDPLTYTLLPSDDANTFYIEAATGKLKVKSAVLNYEVKPLYVRSATAVSATRRCVSHKAASGRLRTGTPCKCRCPIHG